MGLRIDGSAHKMSADFWVSIKKNNGFVDFARAADHRSVLKSATDFGF